MRRKHRRLHRETVSQKGKKIDIFFIIFLLPQREVLTNLPTNTIKMAASTPSSSSEQQH
jgi:hypothetical protein|tara:strand:+ start:1026 stop:1202 length:177 start_codon:yes stop_codon:yes gene_type:complete